jgi:cytoskeletal protein RodZ
MVFETKKIQREILSEYLREVRAAHDLTIEQVAERTGVQQKFIEYLEGAQFTKLPPDVYVIGFLKSLAALYGASIDELITQFKKERAMVDPKYSKAHGGRASFKKVLQTIVITPKLVSIVAGVFFLVLTIGYILFQVAAINSPPVLVIDEPKSGQIITGSVVEVSGKTEPGTSLKINDQTIFVAADGKFRTSIGVTAGQKELLFNAKDKFENEVKQNVSVVVNQPQVAGEHTEEKTTVTVELTFSSPATITIKRDDDQPSTERIGSGVVKKIEAKSRVSIKGTINM